MIPNSTRERYNVISVNLHPFLPIFHARSNSTGWSNSTGYEILLKMGVNSLRLIVCLPSQIGYHPNAMNSTGIYFNGFTPNLTGQISNSTGHEILVKLGGNSLYASLVELGIIPMNSTSIYLNGFTPNSTGQIRLVGQI